ncbi:HvfC/BufC N-terminal domain-containing protein, partial [Paraburkholderia bannensis]|uniref:HvfC/BufC N-terminal domain-containing protein n=1 Tax=Paraburkholderia bannensis TaxID=765414 RepID=UPI0005AA11F7
MLDPTLAVPEGLVGPDALPSARRFGVYRNSVVRGLVEALRAAFPVVCRLVGDEFFTAMAHAYAVFEPPQTPVMLAYGATFPDFIATFEPALSVPYLSDVARL